MKSYKSHTTQRKADVRSLVKALHEEKWEQKLEIHHEAAELTCCELTHLLALALKQLGKPLEITDPDKLGKGLPEGVTIWQNSETRQSKVSSYSLEPLGEIEDFLRANIPGEVEGQIRVRPISENLLFLNIDSNGESIRDIPTSIRQLENIIEKSREILAMREQT